MVETLATTDPAVVTESFTWLTNIIKGFSVGLMMWVVSYVINRAWCSFWYMAS